MERADPLILDWCQWLLRNEGLSERTVDKYLGYLVRLQAYLVTLDAPATLATATFDDLRAFTGPVAHEMGLAPRSRRALVAAVKGFFKWAYRFGKLPENPAVNLAYPKAGQALPVAMQLHHAESLLMQPDMTTFQGVRDAAIIAVIIGCGLRVSEVSGLNEVDSLLWDYRDGVQTVDLKVRGKGDKERIVPAPEEVLYLLHAYLGHEELEAIDRTLEDGDRVLFVSTRNRNVPECDYRGEARRLAPRSIHRLIERHGTAAGLPANVLHPHAGRHLFGAEHAEEDIDLLARQALLGHANAKDTKIYTHLAVRKLRQAAEKGNPLRKINTPVSDLIRAMRAPAT